jgi:hypothetical protein
LRKTLIQAILARYLADYEQPKLGVPRFLLDDVLRYWRTLAVDCQAKRWEQVAPDWGLRYLKLIIWRKLTFAGTLATLLCTEQASIPYFTVQFEMPALARLAQLHQLLEPALRQHLATAILIAEEFTQAVSDEAFRNEARAIKRRADIRSGTRFGAMHQKGRALQTALAAIFFDSGKLRERSRKYLSF